MVVEEWRQVPIQKYNMYEISSLGRVRRENRILKPKPITDRSQYSSVALSANQVMKIIGVHVLIAKAFIPNDRPDIKKYVNHKDGNKLNNSIDNLEWCTASENSRHFIDELGKMPSSTNKGVLQIDIETNKVIRKFDTMTEASKCTGIKSVHISKVCLGKQNTTGGFKWKYEHHAEPPFDARKLPNNDWPNYSFTENGRIYNTHHKRYDSPSIQQGICYMPGRGKKGVERSLARIIAKLFVPNPHHYDYVLHIDGDKMNNAASNLKWSHRSSERTNQPKKIVEQWTLDGTYIMTYPCAEEASLATGVPKVKIYQIASGIIKPHEYQWKYTD